MGCGGLCGFGGGFLCGVGAAASCAAFGGGYGIVGKGGRDGRGSSRGDRDGSISVAAQEYDPKLWSAPMINEQPNTNWDNATIEDFPERIRQRYDYWRKQTKYCRDDGAPPRYHHAIALIEYACRRAFPKAAMMAGENQDIIGWEGDPRDREGPLMGLRWAAGVEGARRPPKREISAKEFAGRGGASRSEAKLAAVRANIAKARAKRDANRAARAAEEAGMAALSGVGEVEGRFHVPEEALSAIQGVL
jgi:hypothetical protein